VVAPTLHLPGGADHLLQRGGDETRKADDTGVFFFCGIHNSLRRDQSPQIQYPVAVTAQDNPDNVFPDVVNIPLNRGQEYLSLSGLHAAVPSSGFLLLHKRLQDGHDFLHHLGAADLLGEKHLPLPKEAAHLAHTPHQGCLHQFQVPNPVSKRLDALLGKTKTNASLIFYTLAVTVVLDNLVNNENSWAYTDSHPGVLFRSINGDGVTPLFGVDEKVDPEEIFKLSLKQKAGEL
jgi:hypothetical protein